jgi:hypothetical protein
MNILVHICQSPLDGAPGEPRHYYFMRTNSLGLLRLALLLSGAGEA